MMGLRTIHGVEESTINIPKHLEGFFEKKHGRVFIKPDYWLVSNAIISEII